MSDSVTIRTRMAPSPTGDVHIGSLRTALYAFAFAKKNHGQFVLRIEDTDQKRLVVGSAGRTLQIFKDFGLIYDEGPDVGGPYGPYVQTERLNIYQKYIKELLDNGHAYYCFCTSDRLEKVRNIQKAAKRVPKYDRHCLHLTPEEVQENLKQGLPFVVRMKVPDNQTVVFNDLIRGEIKFQTNDIDDQVLIKSNGIPTYHFAVVVDDHLMKISHIIRAEEWISSTPKHVLLYQYFGWDIPAIAHLTVLLDPTHSGKMSKRYGSVFARQFLDDGYLPQALLNFLMLLGWNPGTDRELFTLDEFVQEFSVEHLHKKAATFDRKKLDYFNGLYIRALSPEELTKNFQKFLPQASDAQLKVLEPVLQERLVKFGDLPEMTKFLFEDVEYDRSLLGNENSVKMLSTTLAYFETLSDLNVDKIKSDLMNFIKDNNWKVGDFFMVFRVAICGVTHTPPVVECLPALTKEDILRKLSLALKKLEV